MPSSISFATYAATAVTHPLSLMFSHKTATVRGYTLNFQTKYLQTNSIGFYTDHLPSWKEGKKYIKNGTYKLIVSNVNINHLCKLNFNLKDKYKMIKTWDICLLT